MYILTDIIIMIEDEMDSPRPSSEGPISDNVNKMNLSLLSCILLTFITLLDNRSRMQWILTIIHCVTLV